MKFSIIIPTYNRAKFISNTIKDVISQTYYNWELIIIDDGSTDNTKKIVSNFLTDKRIKYIYQKNQERSAARNNGIKKANGDYICFIDSDEKLNPNHIQKISNGIKKNEFKVGVYHYDIGFLFPDSKNNYIRKGKDFGFPVNPNELTSTIIGVPQLCLPKSIMKEYYFNSKITIGEDVELLFRIIEKYPIFYIKGETTISEIEHENRSVNKSTNSCLKEQETFKLIFKRGHPGNKVSWKFKRKKWGTIYLRLCYYYFHKKNRKLIAKNAMLSLINDPFDKFNFKINILFHSIFRFSKIKKLFN